jgi:hypothetical protein
MNEAGEMGTHIYNNKTLFLLTVFIYFLLGMMACSQEENAHYPPPLRPIVYSEISTAEDQPIISGYEMWREGSDPTAFPPEEVRPVSGLGQGEVSLRRTAVLSNPELLARQFFIAFCGSTGIPLEDLVLSSEDYAALTYLSQEASEERMNAVTSSLMLLSEEFTGVENGGGGLGSMLTIENVNVGALRMADGTLSEEAGTGVMVWGTEILARYQETDLVFSIRFPKVLQGLEGDWGIAEAIEVDHRLQMFMEMGFHLPPEMLAFEHYPIPFQTGNYWSYSVREALRTGAVADEVEPHEGHTVRDEVLRREDYNGYALVQIQRTYGEEERAPEQRYYLLSATRLFECSRECRRHIEDMDWLLLHLSNQVTPVLLLPMNVGLTWRRGGRLDEGGSHRSWSDLETVQVPGGMFERAYHISYSSRSGLEHWYWVADVGPALIRIDGSTAITSFELIDYRVLP